MPPVHASAIVDSRARLASDVVVGPYVVIEGEVRVGPGCVFHAHCIVRGPTTMGMGNVVHPFAVVGGEPQARRSDGSPSRLEVGDGNVFREHTTIHGGTDGRATTIGAHNLFMVGAHVAHDVTIGSYGVFANSVQLAGHVVVEDWATFGGQSGVAQHVRVGESAFVAAASACERSVPPFVIVQGDRARIRGINVVGLRRRGIPEGSIAALKRAVGRILSSTHVADTLLALEEEPDRYVGQLVRALRAQRLR